MMSEGYCMRIMYLVQVLPIFQRKLIIKIHLLETANVLTWHFKPVDLELADRQVLSLIDVDSDESAHYGLVAWDGASLPEAELSRNVHTL